MTDATSVRRRRRNSGTDSLPRDLREWFEGEREPSKSRTLVPWSALIYPDYVLLPERWLAWKAEHPKAKPPTGYEWLDDPTSKRHPAKWLLEPARRCAGGQP